MRIWCVLSPPLGKLDGKLFSPLASIRLRCLEIAPALAATGHSIKLVLATELKEQMNVPTSDACDLLIIYKVLSDISEEVRQIRECNVPVILDVTEHIFDNEISGPFYVKMLPHADLVTVSSRKLKDLVSALVKKPVAFIPDSVEGPGSKLRPEKPTGALNLLWFGRSSSATPLYQFLARWERVSGHPRIKLHIVSDIQNLTMPEAQSGVEIRLFEWSPSTVDTCLSWSHAVLFPSGDEEVTQLKSANRVQQTLWNSRLPVGDMIESYQDFAGFALFGQPISQNLHRLWSDWDEIYQRVSGGYTMVENNFTASNVAALWTKRIDRVAKGTP